MKGTRRNLDRDFVGREYARIFAGLQRTNIVAALPRSRAVGVVGIDGAEYPVPTLAQVRQVLRASRRLVARKRRQGSRS